MLPARMTHCGGSQVLDAGEGVDMANTDGSNENLKGAYEQLCNSYRAIDDFRAKLLGFLPLVTGGGLLLLAGQATDVKDFFRPAGLFGIAVTIGLLAYELFGIRKCHHLLEAGRALEKKMDLPAGQFIDRPKHLLGIVNEPFAAAAIYPAVLAAWTYLAFYFGYRDWGRIISPIVFFAGAAGILLYDQSLNDKPKPRWLFSFTRSLRSQPQYQPPVEADEHAGTPSRADSIGTVD
jgi:hypothetical protein